MSGYVYGSEVTEATVKRQPGYHKDDPVTRHDVAALALKMIAAENKQTRACDQLEKWAVEYGWVNAAATKCMIYNATGVSMTLNTYKDFVGHTGDAPYPPEIKNGQWGIFFHQKPSIVTACSHGAVVYNLTDQAPNKVHMLGVLSWLTGWGPDPNCCYGEIVSTVNDDYFNRFRDTMFSKNEHYCTAIEGGLDASMNIGGNAISDWSAIVKLLP